MNTRSFESHVDLLESFSLHVAALPSEAWDRLRVQCAPLSGRTPDMLLARAQLYASYTAAQFAAHRTAHRTAHRIANRTSHRSAHQTVHQTVHQAVHRTAPISAQRSVHHTAHRTAPMTRVIADATTSAVTAISDVIETLLTAVPTRDTDRAPRFRLTRAPVAERYADALSRIAAAVATHTRRVDGVGTAIEAAAGALLRRDAIPEIEFHRVYAWVEAEIPYRSIEPVPQPTH